MGVRLVLDRYFDKPFILIRASYFMLITQIKITKNSNNNEQLSFRTVQKEKGLAYKIRLIIIFSRHLWYILRYPVFTFLKPNFKV